MTVDHAKSPPAPADLEAASAPPFALPLAEHILEYMSDAFFALDIHGNFTYLNRQAEMLLGRTRQELLGQKFWETFSEAMHSEFYRAYQQAAPQQSSFNAEVFCPSSRHWFALRAESYEAGYAVFFQDITARKQAAGEQDSLASLVESSLVAIVALTVECRITGWNHGAEELYGYAAAEVLGTSFARLIPAERWNEFEQIRERALQGERTPPYETDCARKDGTRITVEKNLSPIKDKTGAVTGLSVIARDVTAQNTTLRTLNLLSSAVRQSQDSILITDNRLDKPGPQIEFVNPAFCRLTGYAPEEILGETPRILQGPKTDWNLMKTLRDNLIQGEGFKGETVNYRKDGSEYTVEWEIGPLRGLDGVTTHFVATQRDVTERRNAQLQARQQLERLAALRAVDMSIIHENDLRFTLKLVLDQVREILGVDAAAMLILNRDSKTLDVTARRGFSAEYVSPMQEGDDEPAVIAAREGRVITLLDLPDGGAAYLAKVAASGERFADYYAVPLVAKGVLRGVMELFQRDTLHPEQDWLEFLETLSGQAAIAVDNAALFADLQRANAELVTSHDATIEGWSRALDLRDKETEGHSERVTDMTVRMAARLHIEGEPLMQIRRGALLHDVGKLGVPDAILLKPGPLTEEEWELMQQHPTYAYEMLYPITFLRDALAIPYCHHEKWDGSGYPNGLAGEDIPFPARLFALADVWDALRSDRPYRAGWPADKVREHIAELAGTHFDPAVVEIFLQMDF